MKQSASPSRGSEGRNRIIMAAAVFAAAFVVLASVCVIINADGSASAAEFKADGIRYEVTSADTVKVIGADDNKEIVIPSTVKDGNVTYNVTEIGSNAFRKHQSMTSVTIPDSVRSIGNRAFEWCTSLKTVDVPDITYLGIYAFSYCTSMTSIQLGKGIVGINTGTFSHCSSLESITLPEGVTDIGSQAFIYCTSLKKINLPSTFFKMMVGANEGCRAIEEYNVSENNTRYCSENGILFNKDKTLLHNYPAGRTAASYTVPDGVTTLGSHAFSEVSMLKSITLSDSVVTLQSEVFKNGTSLRSVYLNEGLKTIGSEVFFGCKYLTSIDIPASVNGISTPSMKGCESLMEINVSKDNMKFSSDSGVLFDKDKTELLCYPGGKTDPSYTVPDTVTTIWHFENNAHVKDVTLPSGLTSIYYFKGCTSLTSIDLPSGVTSVSSSAFEDCKSLVSVSIPSGLSSIGNSTFRNCMSLKTVTLPDTLNSIESYAFMNCRSLTDITMPSGITEIGASAFDGCVSLRSIALPNGIDEIKSSTFRNCTSLESIAIPANVTEIGEKAFMECVKLKSIEIHANVTNIDTRAFINCISLEQITVADGNAFYTSVDGILFTKDRTELIQYPAAKQSTSYTVPDYVKTVSDYAFYGCTSLVYADIPAGVDSIGLSAFNMCVSLRAITVSDGNANYCSDDGVLFSKNKTQLIQYPAGKTEERYALPDSVTTVYEGSFMHACHLKEFTVSENNASFSACKGIILSKDGKTAIAFPAGLKECIVPDSVTSVSPGAINGYEVERIVIPENVVFLDMGAIYECPELKEVVVRNPNLSMGEIPFYFLDANLHKITVRAPEGFEFPEYACGDLVEFEYKPLNDGDGGNKTALIVGISCAAGAAVIACAAAIVIRKRRAV